MRFTFFTALMVALCACNTASSPQNPLPTPSVAKVPPKIEFWDTPRRGANYFKAPMTPAWLDAATGANIGWVRLSTASWPREDGHRDHLIGSADGYSTIPKSDVVQLGAQLDLAHKHGMPVVLTVLSLPGARWRQHNNYKNDLRLWNEPETFQPQVARFWRDLVALLGEHPGLVAVNVLNEPRPPSPEQLGPFYAQVVQAIREVHPTIPVMLDVGKDAAPDTITALEPLADANILYAVHVYEPWDFVTWRRHRGALSYPGPDKRGQTIDGSFLRATLEPVVAWQKRHGIRGSRVVMAEFGIDRRMQGADGYLRDLVCVAEAQSWHWGFYAFRDWQAMDYEFGSKPPPPEYWQAEERGEKMELPRVDNPMFQTLRRGLQGQLSDDCPTF